MHTYLSTKMFTGTGYTFLQRRARSHLFFLKMRTDAWIIEGEKRNNAEQRREIIQKNEEHESSSLTAGGAVLRGKILHKIFFLIIL